MVHVVCCKCQNVLAIHVTAGIYYSRPDHSLSCLCVTRKHHFFPVIFSSICVVQRRERFLFVLFSHLVFFLSLSCSNHYSCVRSNLIKRSFDNFEGWAQVNILILLYRYHVCVCALWLAYINGRACKINADLESDNFHGNSWKVEVWFPFLSVSCHACEGWCFHPHSISYIAHMSVFIFFHLILSAYLHFDIHVWMDVYIYISTLTIGPSIDSFYSLRSVMLTESRYGRPL